MEDKNLFIIGYGLDGGFGGVNNFEVVQAINIDDANITAFHKACEHYESYEGLYGLRSVDEIIEEDGVTEKEANEIYREERESWLCYQAEPYSEEREAYYAEKFGIHNRFKFKEDGESEA